MTIDEESVVIVGAGHAGAHAAIALRNGGFGGSVAMISEETEFPYERPPLSKEYLLGERSFERLLLRPPEFWQERRIRMLLGRRATSVDARARAVTLDSGETIGYRHLIWAAGAAPRTLDCEGNGLAGVHVLRTRDHADRLRRELDSASRAVIIGGGYIGLEAAAALRTLGKQVVVLESLDRLLARVTGTELSRFMEAEHRARGVLVRTGVRIDSLIGESGRVCGVRLSDGEQITADLVIVGIGITPRVEPLLAAGAQGGNGVLVDAACRTSLAGVHAIGDCALHHSRYAEGTAIRLESVQNACDQAATVAKNILGVPAIYDSMPWFWSNQYDLRVQTAGLCAGHDRAVVRGDPQSRSFSVVYLKHGRAVALDCVNAPKDYSQGRRLVAQRPPANAEKLADPAVPLRECCA